MIAGAERFAFAWIEASLVAWARSMATATPTPVVPVVALPSAVVESLVLELELMLIALVPVICPVEAMYASVSRVRSVTASAPTTPTAPSLVLALYVVRSVWVDGSF